MLTIWLGVLLVIAGLLYLARQSIWRGRMSDPTTSQVESRSPTLEPARRGVRFLGLGTNWPGLAMMVVGAILLLSQAIL
ncbi:hypothetical protein MesoLjLc_39620 [Mesorhizobium sp. L-8-10]|uniref:hypothetical protein n=1 Tax=unclassified Mesorhizobium TaxID=325217 RepID=UPI001927F420|nr:MULTISPECIES: hypothetical protein [unclassified Mesorhizobium]BCH24305.1 hypothetical protein MesoLjLb_40900 [Mesorhizobium sp. L-8-3]BCH32032.1 hypothetical protein MesoLjLc_39620 [Mesorhizobium sp. L-8-10]